jgi:deoxyguanosine kinase
MFRYIVVEGPIGVGKTSLTRLLAKAFKGRCILEKPEENPFLSRFYEDRRKFAFQTQVFFLLSRFQQQQELLQPDLFSQVVFSDYLLAKDRIFAHLNLDEDELALYETIFRLLSGRIPAPDLVIFLQARPDVLLQRVKSREIVFERPIDLDYLRRLTAAYNDFFFHYDRTPLLVVDTSEINFVSRPEDLDQLIREIRGMRQGTCYFVPMRSK